ncbi:bacterial transcriptional activator domain-containing protein [Streptomyces sp. NPDC058301]|uniref:bacterial transcriptional activator domain-containing protein n=1 Tax=Streptomyces sp. NPDC058301 TaxID=3346436 RepID=UPI0036EC9B13
MFSVCGSGARAPRPGGVGRPGGAARARGLGPGAPRHRRVQRPARRGGRPRGARGIARLRVDVRDFLAAARHALALADRSGSHAYAGLADAELLYRGDVLEDEPYAEWAVALREEAQAVHSELLARLATAAAERGDHHAEVPFRLRLLERDPYDEDTHLALIALLAGAGRHGEARRRHLLYVERMAEIDVEPSPFPRPDRRARGPARPAQRGRD